MKKKMLLIVMFMFAGWSMSCSQDKSEEQQNPGKSGKADSTACWPTGQCTPADVCLEVGGKIAEHLDCSEFEGTSCCYFDDTEPTECEENGGQCLSSPIDVGYPANCEDDYGMEYMDMDCGGGINLSCCVEKQTACQTEEECEEGWVCDIHGCDEDAQGICAPSRDLCPATWEPECGCDGLTYSNSCMRVGNKVALDYLGECGGGESECETEGGQCLSSPIDITYPANCEEDYGMTTVELLCPAMNQSCCMDTTPNSCSEAQSYEECDGYFFDECVWDIDECVGNPCLEKSMEECIEILGCMWGTFQGDVTGCAWIGHAGPE